MISEFLGANRIADRVQRNRKRRGIERLDRHSAIDESHVAAFARRRRITGILFRQLREISTGTKLLHNVFRFRFSRGVLLRRGVRVDFNQDMEDVRRLGTLVVFL